MQYRIRDIFTCKMLVFLAKHLLSAAIRAESSIVVLGCAVDSRDILALLMMILDASDAAGVRLPWL